jgi:hypothetical protein
LIFLSYLLKSSSIFRFTFFEILSNWDFINYRNWVYFSLNLPFK